MSAFVSMIDTLESNGAVRRDQMEPDTTMRVVDGELVCQRGDSKPYPYQLSWHEINATDWRVADSTSNHLQTSL